jgi:hypothetical protein
MGADGLYSSRPTAVEERQTGKDHMPGAMRKGRTAIAGYLAFVVALLLVVIASNQAVADSSVIIGLLATSLPALVAWLYVESIAWEGAEPDRRIVRRMVSAVALTLSVAGFLLTLWNFSRLTVVLIVVETGVWYLVISGVFYLNQKKD